MERPRDDHKLTHNVRLATRDKLFGGTVSRLQVSRPVCAAPSAPTAGPAGAAAGRKGGGSAAQARSASEREALLCPSSTCPCTGGGAGGRRRGLPRAGGEQGVRGGGGDRRPRTFLRRAAGGAPLGWVGGGGRVGGPCAHPLGTCLIVDSGGSLLSAVLPRGACCVAAGSLLGLETTASQLRKVEGGWRNTPWAQRRAAHAPGERLFQRHAAALTASPHRLQRSPKRSARRRARQRPPWQPRSPRRRRRWRTPRARWPRSASASRAPQRRRPRRANANRQCARSRARC
jgi:hypothetical protein